MCSIKMAEIDNEALFSSSDEGETIEITNEHNQVIGHLLGKLPALQDSDKDESFQESDGDDSSQSSQNQVSSPSPVNDNESNVEVPDFPSDYSESDDNAEDYYDILTDDENEPQPIEHVTVPCVNFANDTEHPNDFGDGWLWQEKDTGSSCGPFMSRASLNLDKNKRNPEDFFEALFDESMWSKMAIETNIYAQENRQKKYGMYSSKGQNMLNPVLSD